MIVVNPVDQMSSNRYGEAMELQAKYGGALAPQEKVAVDTHMRRQERDREAIRAKMDARPKMADWQILDESWKLQGACASVGLKASEEVFMPPVSIDALSERRWDTFCHSCPVKAECAQYGAQTGSSGVWGGELVLSDIEASKLRGKIAQRRALPPAEREALLVLVGGAPLKRHTGTSGGKVARTWYNTDCPKVPAEFSYRKIEGEDRELLKKKIRARYEEGASIRSLAREFTLGYGRAYTLLVDSGVTIRPQGSPRMGTTECPHGHEYTPENSRFNRKGKRSCRTCENGRRRGIHLLNQEVGN